MHLSTFNEPIRANRPDFGIPPLASPYETENAGHRATRIDPTDQQCCQWDAVGKYGEIW